MHLSRYTKIFPSHKDDGFRILFSTKNASAVLVPAELVSDIENERISQAERESLEGLGLLTADSGREKREMLCYIQDLNSLNSSIRIIVVLNLDCNLACTYCFEGSRKGKLYLSEETADSFVDFVKKRDLTDKTKIQVTFYGGEPLLSVPRIIAISRKLGEYAAEKGVAYEFGLVTNGTLLTAEVVRKLMPLGLTSAKVTLDGPQEIHNKYRPFKSGKDSFDVIVRNVTEVCELIDIQIGGNYTRGNFERFPRLLEHLEVCGLSSRKIPIVKFDPVMQESGEFGMPDFHDGCTSINEPWISDAALLLRREVLKRGYKTQQIAPAPCLLEFTESFVVNYDGSLYKCPGLIGRQQCCVGDVRAGVHDYRISHGLDVWKNEQCLECSYLPLCFGGCRYMQLLKTGSMQGLNCPKEYLERTLCHLVAQDLEFNL